MRNEKNITIADKTKMEIVKTKSMSSEPVSKKKRGTRDFLFLVKTKSEFL